MKSTNYKILAFAVCLLFSVSSWAKESALGEVSKLVGQYAGHWVMYGIVNNQIAPIARWSEVLVVKNPKLQAGRAVVEVENTKTIKDGRTETLKYIEGYFATEDGSVGERFIEIEGKLLHIKKLNDTNWSYYSEPSSEELKQLGFEPEQVLSASHVTVRTLTSVGKRETAHITRVTTVQWRDTSGLIQSPQFLSLMGVVFR